MSQKYLSANTCINGEQGRLPALYSKITFTPGTTVFDYGCGKTITLLEEKAKQDGADWIGYDLNWHPDNLDQLENGVDLSVCCNVLNVIDDDNIIKEIINKLATYSKEVIFQIYTGNKSGIGSPTQNNTSWQRNAKRSWYEELIKSLGYTITKATGDFIYIKGVN